MKRQVYINESQLQVIKESKDEVTFFRFFEDCKKFIQELLNGNIKAVPSDTLRKHSLSSNRLESYLIRNHIITKKEDVRETYDNEKKKYVSMYYAIYSVPKKNFVKKMMLVCLLLAGLALLILKQVLLLILTLDIILHY